MTEKTELLLKRRMFLNNNEACLDGVSWELRIYKNHRGEFLYLGTFTIAKDKTRLILHSNNDGIDINFVCFADKMRKLANRIREFVTGVKKRPKRNFKPSTKREWLNEQDNIDISFTGAVVSTYLEDRSIFEISSCDRSLRWTVVLARWADKVNETELQELTKLLFSINHLLSAIEELNRRELT